MRDEAGRLAGWRLLTSEPGTARVSLAFSAGLLFVTAVLVAVLFQVIRQNGRIPLRLDELETGQRPANPAPGTGTVPRVGLPIGSQAPDFRLAGLHGEMLTLASQIAVGLPLLLTFTDPGCGSCTALLPPLSEWERELRGRATFVTISRGGADQNLKKYAHLPGTVLLQQDREIATAYQAHGTPSAVLIDTGGRIASPVAAGAEAIRKLVDTLSGPDARPSERRVPQLAPFGGPAPDVPLTSLSGEAAGPAADRPLRVAGSYVVELAEGLMVRPAGSPAAHQLNNTASVILELCDGHRTVNQIAGALAEEFGLDADPLAEVTACVAGLRSAGILADHTAGCIQRNGPADDPFGFFGAIYCLNLDQRPDRWRAAVRRFSMLGMAARVERFPAVATPHNRYVGCATSWRLMVAEARDRGLGNFLGIEDDAIFLDETLEVLRRAVSELEGLSWDLLYLGGAAWEPSVKVPGHVGVAVDQPGVVAAAGEQVIVAAAFDDLAVVKDHDLVGVADGRQPVRDRGMLSRRRHQFQAEDQIQTRRAGIWMHGREACGEAGKGSQPARRGEGSPGHDDQRRHRGGGHVLRGVEGR
jgi:peroxiredoxin